jgi:hypothetical protein
LLAQNKRGLSTRLKPRGLKASFYAAALLAFLALAVFFLAFAARSSRT